MEQEKAHPFKLYNLRVLPLFAAYLILGIFCVKYDLWIAAIIGSVAVLFLFFLWKSASLRRSLAIALLAALLLGYGLASLNLYLRNEVGVTGAHEVTCRVIETEIFDDHIRVTADKLRVEGKTRLGKVTFDTTEEIAVGDLVSAEGELSIRDVTFGSFLMNVDYRTGAKYKLEPTALSLESGTPPLRHTIRTKIYAVLTEAQGERAGSFTYAMLFGDSDKMWEEDKAAMRDVGVAHVFAVSGLHVGVLAAALLFLLRKLRVKEGVSNLILLPIFGFYAYLASFSPSVLRAGIMVTVALTASSLGRRYDDISALSFAAILILLARPLYLFDLSFLLSFLSILGIQCLARPIQRSLLKKRMCPRLASGLALSLATTIALVPVSALVFGRISLVGFALNLLVVPIASLAYVLTLVALIPSILIPSFKALLAVIGYLPEIIADLSIKTAALGLTTNYDFSAAEVAVYYGTIAFTGKYSLAKRTVKLVAAGIGVGVLTILILAG